MLAFYCQLAGHRKTSGIILGCITLVKPQYGLLLIWAICRKKWGMAGSGILCIATGVLVSLLVFGLRNTMDYVHVLEVVGRQGEAYFPNQSVNGLVNRLIFNGRNLKWLWTTYPPYSPVVYIMTVLSSFIFIGLGLWFPSKRSKGGMADFSCMAILATMASPIAWSHHYGILLPVFYGFI